jgi:hypothetical protein
LDPLVKEIKLLVKQVKQGASRQDVVHYMIAKRGLEGNALMGARESAEWLKDQLDASVVNLAVNAYFGSDLGRGYKAGAATAESIPFMLEMVANPISASGSALAKGLLKYGIKRYGLKVAGTGGGKVLKTVAGLGGRGVAAGGMTATTGSFRVAAGAFERMRGDIKFEMDDFGRFSFNGTENRKETDEAVLGAFTDVFIENYSEMVGDMFGPALKSLGGVIEKIPGVKRLSASGIGKLYRGIANNPQLKRIAEKTQYNGAIGEGGEEVFGNLMRVATGEMSWEEFTDADQNIDTFIAVSSMSVLFGTLRLGGLAMESYKTSRTINSFEKSLSEKESARWSEIKQQVKGGDIETTREAIKAVVKDPSLSPE